MRKLLSLLLTLTMFLPLAARAASGLTVETPQDAVRPGKAAIIAFDAPQAGRADILVKDAAGQTVSVVAQGYEAATGHNEILWNGTYQSVPAPAGSYTLFVTLGGETAQTPIVIGDIAPYLTYISVPDPTVTGDKPMNVTYYASVDGTVAFGVMVNDVWTLVDSQEVKAGENSFAWDGTAEGAPLADGSYAFTLTLTDAEGFDSNEEHVTAAVSGLTAETSAPAQASAAAETGPAAGQDTAAPASAEDATIIEPDDYDAAATEQSVLAQLPDQSQFTPSYGSPYTDDATTNYWTLPMDITDEKAVWDMLMEPITVIDGNEKTQVILRAEPDENSAGVGVATRATQGLHVLKTLDNGWTLVECYSSSFHGTKIEAWNMLVQGYVKTDTLIQKQPSSEMGIVIDKLTQRLYLFKEGKLFTTLLVSTGLSNERQPYNETRSGEFITASPVGEFRSDNLACSMAIRFNSGDLLHEVPHLIMKDGGKDYSTTEFKLGTKASHGCIRVQRKRTPEGTNMNWIWQNRAKNMKLVVWEDWQGRQIPIPAGDTLLYYNPDGGVSYHRSPTCYSVKNDGVQFQSFTYDQLDEEPYKSLQWCDYCAPALRLSDIEAINAVYAVGGDHDPVLTEARKEFLQK